MPGVIHESGAKSVEETMMQFINNATKTMMYITYAINNDVLFYLITLMIITILHEH